MKKIVSLLFTVLLIPTLLAVEYIPVEESQRIRIEGYDINNGDDYLTAYDGNDIDIEYVSAYSDIGYTIKQEPESEKVIITEYKDYYLVSYEEKVPFRIEFKRDSNPDIIYYQDIEIPCQEPDLASVDVPISFYTGNTTEFGAVSGNTVYAIAEPVDGIEYSFWYVTDEDDNIIIAGEADNLDEESQTILPASKSIAGKYKFCVEVFENSERKVVIKEFEIVD